MRILMAIMVGAMLWLKPDPLELGNTGVALESAAAQQSAKMYRFKRERKEYRRRMNALAGVDEEDIRWGKERKGSRTTVVVLDPPLKKVSGPDKVDVEWFYHCLDRTGSTKAPIAATYVTQSQWWIANLSREGLPINFVEQLVGGHGEATNHFAAARRRIQEARYGARHLFHDHRREEGRTLMRNLGRMWAYEEGGSMRLLESIEDVESLATHAKIPAGAWRIVQDRWVRDRIDDVEERWAGIVSQGTRAYSKTFDGLADPVLLIDGKYLVTVNTVGRQGMRAAVKRVLQTANWLIRRQLEKIPTGAISTAKHEEKTTVATIGRSGVLTNRIPKEYETDIEIEVLFSYITDKGEYNDVLTADRHIGDWFASLGPRGIDGVTVFWTPVSGEGVGAERQRRHQRLMLAWERWRNPEQMDIHRALGTETFYDGGSIDSEKAEEGFLDQIGISPRLYRARLAGRKAKERIARAQAKVTAARAALMDEAPDKVTGLVFVVNGEIALESSYSEDLTSVLERLEELMKGEGGV